MFVAIKSNEFYAVYLVNVDTMTKTFTSNVRNSEGIQVVNEEFLSKFSDANTTIKTPKTSIVEVLDQLIEERQIKHKQKWNANVDKFNSIVDILFSI